MKSVNVPWYDPDKRYHPPGTEPGTLAWHHPDREKPPLINIMQYGPEYFSEKTVTTLEELWTEERSDVITWINVEGISDPETLAFIGDHYDLHPLSLEDVLNAGQRPKIEKFDDYYFIVMYLISEQEQKKTRQVSIFWGKDFIITLEEQEEGAFELIRDRLRISKARIREMGSDYLAYCIIDALIDCFFPRMESLQEELEQLEESVYQAQDKNSVHMIHQIKIKLMFLAKLIWNIQELIDAIQGEEVELNTPNINFYLRDCFDHTVQISHTIDNYREFCNGLIDTNLALINSQQNEVMSQQNEVMKVLTIIATIFIPLTFIVGVYGMNFDTQAGPLSMPELNWAFGYVVVWGVMILISLGMLYYFRRRKWL